MFRCALLVNKYYLLLANDWLPVMTSHVIEAWLTLDNDGQTVLPPLRIVGLATAPPVLTMSSGHPHWPCHGARAMVHTASRPEVGLTLPAPT